MRGPTTAAVLLALGGGARAAPPGPAGVEFFEKKIRPVLADHCGKCHSADAARNNKLKGGLLVDSRAGLLAGGDSGPAVVPGKPADSLLLKSLRHDDDLKMPPAGKLPDAVVADFERWIAVGAPDPREAVGGVAKRVGMTVEAGREFWAYKRPTPPAVPAVRDAGWPAGDIDKFVLARLEAAGLGPAPDADPATLARRVTFDLTGLPPTPEEAAAFAADRSPDAYDKLVGRLLASPGFGERWGRHWLDVARYAESVTLRGLVFKEAWRYRDYVIDSLNRDVPFDRFVREQVAGDLLPAPTPADRHRQLVATTYLMLGNTNLEEQDKKQLRMDVVDEQLDVISKGILAQTVTCARCHDHKFDPIPTADYYALAGILRNSKTTEPANVSAWTEVPLPVDPATDAALQEKDARVAALKAQLKAAKAVAGKAAAAKGVLAVADVPGVAVDDTKAKKVGDWQESTHSGAYVGTGYVHDRNTDKGRKTLTFAPALPADGRYEVRLAYSPGASRARDVPVTVFGADGETTVPVDMRAPPPVDGRWVSLGTFRFEKAGQSFVIVATDGTAGHVTADCVTFVPAAGGTAGAAGDVTRLEADLRAAEAAGPRRPMAMAPVEEGAGEDCRVHIRGLVGNQGELVPRGFLRVATAGPTPPLPKDQSGRAQLADWLASSDNPLTARVFANRAWHWLFGAGLVRTVDNFGTTGEPPSHPELLDHLAVRFVADGWSVKKLVRTIVLSRTYRRSAATSHRSQIDPENRLLGRANRRRLEAECLRDAMLCASGRLDPARGGPTFPPTLAADYGFAAAEPRRSVYLPAFRNAMPDLLEAFDGADPSVVTGRRNASTVAPQALALMNHPFVVEQAKHAADRLLAAGPGDDAGRADRAYRLAVGRPPTAGERRAVDRYLAARPGDWAGVFHALFASADFRTLD